MNRLWEKFGPLLLTSAILGATLIPPAFLSHSPAGTKPRKPTEAERKCIDDLTNFKMMIDFADDAGVKPPEFRRMTLDEVFAICLGGKDWEKYLQKIREYRSANP